MATRKTTQDTFEATVKAGQENFESFIKTSTQAFQKNFEQSFGSGGKHIEELVKGYSDVTAYGKENAEAVVASGTLAAKNLETINTEFFGFTKKLFEGNVAAMKALTTVKTPQEFFQTQNEIFKSRYEDVVKEATKLSEMTKALAAESMEPISDRVNTNVETVKKQFAA